MCLFSSKFRLLISPLVYHGDVNVGPHLGQRRRGSLLPKSADAQHGAAGSASLALGLLRAAGGWCRDGRSGALRDLTREKISFFP